ncbi:adenylosuccinate synthase [Dactylosporangium maewongense]|uniref:Adenylosuccinate synthetase n=1 Tax=Dactylosporangium maewongense TaxID=634393 RepID=A0ABN2A9W6_9ACTN
MQHVIVVDLGYGDCGKGTVVDHLCATRDVHTVVRFNGGAQAAHTVVLGDGRKHTFAQFGSGTFRPGVRTHLSRFMVVDPLTLAAEADHLVGLGVHDVWSRLTVDRAALLSTPYHREANRAKEIARGADRHGSCGMGVGEAMAYALRHPDDAPRAGDCTDPPLLRAKLRRLRSNLGVDGPPVDACVEAYAAFATTVSIVDGLRIEGPCVFEGAQGVLLDEWHGFHPYTTWSTTTFANAETLLAGEPAYRLGVLRTFTTRHGAGPLVTEDPSLPVTDPNNPANPWQGAFRVGHFDAVAHRYALDVCGGVDGLALTHLDTASAHPDLRMCVDYDGVKPTRGPTGDLDRQERLTRAMASSRPRLVPVDDWTAAVEEQLSAPVVLESHGPRSEDKTSTDSAPTVAARVTC